MSISVYTYTHTHNRKGKRAVYTATMYGSTKQRNTAHTDITAYRLLYKDRGATATPR